MEIYYLEFLAFLLKQSLSLEQIQEIGRILRNMTKRNKIHFFSFFSFDGEEIAKISTAFGKCLLSDITDDLSSGRYSLSIDNSTVAKESIGGLKVRYLKDYEDFVTGVNDLKTAIIKTKIENKILGIKYLQGSSDAETQLQIVNEKLFNLGENVKKNLIGGTPSSVNEDQTESITDLLACLKKLKLNNSSKIKDETKKQLK